MHNFKKSVAAIAVAASLGLSFNAMAASEALSGSVNAANASEYTVQAKDPKTGSTRTVSVNADGSFRFAKMETGVYHVIVMKNGTKVAEDDVRVSLGSSAFAAFDLNENIESIEVRGARISSIDLSTTDSGLVIGESELDIMPIARNMTAVALLAPGTVQGDSGFGNTASFGGASVSENACFINGLEVTNTRNGLGCGSVPFEFYKEFQVKTGGYSAEFGRATGGTINAVTKSGTNDWEFGATANWTPSGLTEDGQVSRADGGTGVVFTDDRNDEFSSFDYSISASGPIIEDTLFIYALINPRDIDNNYAINANGRYGALDEFDTRESSGGDNLFWGAKIDWDISDNHRLSYFAYSNRNDTVENRYSYDAETQVRGDNIGTFLNMRGGDAQSISYTGYLTDDLNISALWGKIETQFLTNALDLNDNCPFVDDQRTNPTVVASRCGSGTTKNSANEDTNTQIRFDAEYLIGDHNFKAGYETQDRSSINAREPIGGHQYTYTNLAVGASLPNNIYTNNTGAVQDIVRDRIFAGGGFSVDMTAYYLEDQWQLTDNLMLSIGLRKDKFSGQGVTGVELFDFDTSIAPRLGFTWDVAGDDESKLYGTYGTYYLPVANNTIFRAASGVSDVRTYYTFTGIDGTNGTPTGLSSVGQVVNSISAIPSKPLFQSEEADPFSRDEYIIGYETALTDDLTVSVRGIYREVTSALDDYCGAFALPYCLLVNPGKSATAFKDGVYYYGRGDERNNIDADNIDWSVLGNADGIPDPGTRTTTTVEQLGLPEANNEYTALQGTLDYRAEDLTLKFIYTWSRSVGNFEGAVKSDINQTDAGVTQDFDFPALMEGADGYQANDRRHVFKAFGSYSVTDDLSIGFNAILSSGKPKSAFGAGHPRSDDGEWYGSYGDTFYIFQGCPDDNGDGACQQAEKDYNFIPRGTVGRTPWTFNMDLNMSYNFEMNGIDTRLSLDIFNVLNSQSVIKINEHYESSEGTVNAYYGAAQAWQAPRSVRVGFEARF
ncbi:MAG: TonB-dependent receptor [Algicola sp.]|nr:TonB-dependent receptor [Algicola sp.]